jgi:hypothetical protein
MRVNLVDTPRGRLWSWVSGRNITLVREGIGMGKRIGVVVEEGEADRVEEVVVEEAEVIDQVENSRVGSNSIDKLHSMNE